MKILLSRITLLSGLLLCATAIFSYLNFKGYFSFYLLSFGTTLAIAHIMFVKLHVKRLLAVLSKDASTSNFHTQVTSATGNAMRAQSDLQKITKAIELLADNENISIETLGLEGKIAGTIKDFQNKIQAIKKEESARIWAAQGIARITEIRMNDQTIEDYSFKIISELVKYVGANQAVFYSIVEKNEQQHLEMTSTYAYGKRKYSSEKIVIEPGCGIIGQSVLEREIIFLTDVPKDYIKITSGLGASLPRCITIIPLVHRENVFGVIELASFQKFEKHHLEFIKKTAENIALELSGIHAQEQTRKLLEQSQEEELRETVEQMKRTQREMIRKEEELSIQLINTQKAKAMAEAEKKKNEAILEGCMDAVITFNQLGIVEFYNTAAEEMFGFPKSEILGSHVSDLLSISVEETRNGSKIIRNGKGNEVNIRTEINCTDKEGEEISLLLTATKVQIEGKFLFTLFAQKVSVDLF